MLTERIYKPHEVLRIEDNLQSAVHAAFKECGWQIDADQVLVSAAPTPGGGDRLVCELSLRHRRIEIDGYRTLDKLAIAEALEDLAAVLRRPDEVSK